MTGSIALVGAGPGAADLLTLRALNRIKAADVIYYDRLIDPQILEFARPDTERVFTGKHVGAHSWPQERICTVIVAAALAGKRVVRLKSGDPGVFGRATEELDAARAHGIEIELVPGVTAASAAAVSLGRALTERGQTDHLVIATGTCKPGDPPPDWAALIRPGTVLALYMAVRAARDMRAALLAAGVPSSLEVQAVSEATTPRERAITTTLAHLPEAMETGRISNPAILFLRWPKQAQPAQILPLVAE
ncbi:uroporphyrinogen-III C-methyltransferase [Thioclava sp. SK-1]|uniref:uroporphyrinogen-III C-methyltransferase n=1 Tax=Thioclava sp. SK-1 TaxID=1889770 RepID=UPI000826B917|nr:uroporphyrinogen-III C-methyltransferase [Thioclava sp. SK-1]OCX65299.1 uroporphyrinogen-III C-methyltransferase [Thioclava sp. SK-1]